MMMHLLTYGPPCMQAATKKSLWDMGLQIFRAHLSRRPEVTRKAVQGLLILIESERTGDQVKRFPWTWSNSLSHCLMNAHVGSAHTVVMQIRVRWRDVH